MSEIIALVGYVAGAMVCSFTIIKGIRVYRESPKAVNTQRFKNIDEKFKHRDFQIESLRRRTDSFQAINSTIASMSSDLQKFITNQTALFQKHVQEQTETTKAQDEKIGEIGVKFDRIMSTSEVIYGIVLAMSNKHGEAKPPEPIIKK